MVNFKKDIGLNLKNFVLVFFFLDRNETSNVSLLFLFLFNFFFYLVHSIKSDISNVIFFILYFRTTKLFSFYLIHLYIFNFILLYFLNASSFFFWNNTKIILSFRVMEFSSFPHTFPVSIFFENRQCNYFRFSSHFKAENFLLYVTRFIYILKSRAKGE